MLEAETLGDAFAPLATEVDGLVRKNHDRLGVPVAVNRAGLEDVVEVAADGAAQVGRSAERVGNPERVAPDAREAHLVTALQANGLACDLRGLALQSESRRLPRCGAERLPGSSTIVAHAHRDDRRGGPGPHEQRPAIAPSPLRSRRWGNETDSELVLDEISVAEVGVLLARGRPVHRLRPAFADSAQRDLELDERQCSEGHDHRHGAADDVREQPSDDDHREDRSRRRSATQRQLFHPLKVVRRIALMLDPLARWKAAGLPDKPDYAGLLTYSGLPYSEDPADLAGLDVAIVGAPTDDLVSDRPGTRFGPRAIRSASCPPGPHLEARVDWFETLRAVDFGDAPVVPSDPTGTARAIESLVHTVAAAGVVPVVLGGDHSIVYPEIAAIAAVHGPVGLVHFDTHTDTGDEVFGVEVSHGTPMYRLVRDGLVEGKRYVQIGLRGYWPGEKEFAWQADNGITSFFMHDVRDRGIAAIVENTVEIVGDGPTFLTVDVDVLDPAYAPGTGTPEPGGMTPVDLLWACRILASRLRIVGMDVVEVIPTAAGSSDITALVAERIVRESLTGLALARGAGA